MMLIITPSAYTKPRNNSLKTRKGITSSLHHLASLFMMVLHRLLPAMRDQVIIGKQGKLFEVI